MEKYYCWPYEELKVSKLEGTRAFRFEVPWYASAVQTTEAGEGQLVETFLSNTEILSSQDILESYRQVLSPLVHEPFAYILPMNEQTLASSLKEDEFLEVAFQNPVLFAQQFQLLNYPAKDEWSWDSEVLQMARIGSSDFYSPLSLYSIFRRFFYLEAMEQDQTQSLYKDLPQICGTPENIQNALGFVIAQNLYVTQQCGPILASALNLAGENQEALEDFIQAETGHDQIMVRALKAFPALADWSLHSHSATQLLMDVFYKIAQNDFLAFAFSICIFERPQFEEQHPVTRMLQEQGLHEAARRYEVHHTINAEGDHDHIGFDMIRKIPVLSHAQAVRSLRWCEVISKVMTAHSGQLLKHIKQNID